MGRLNRFGWAIEDIIPENGEGEPDYEEISLAETVEDRNRGETPQ